MEDLVSWSRGAARVAVAADRTLGEAGLLGSRRVGTTVTAAATVVTFLTVTWSLAIEAGTSTTKTGNDGNFGGLGWVGTSLCRAWVVLVLVFAIAEEGLKNGAVVSDLDGAFSTAVIGVDVGLATFDLGALWRVVALDGDRVKKCVVVTVLLNVFGLPVDEASGPSDGTLSVCGQTGRPEGELDTSGCGRVVVLVGGFIHRAITIESTDDLAVNAPGNCFRLPVDLIGMILIESIRE